MPWYESNDGEGLTDWLNGKNKYSLGGETSVEAQVDDPDSMLNHYKELLSQSVRPSPSLLSYHGMGSRMFWSGFMPCKPTSSP